MVLDSWRDMGTGTLIPQGLRLQGLRFRGRGGHARGNAFEAHGVDASYCEAETAGSERRDLGGIGWQLQALWDLDRAGLQCSRAERRGQRIGTVAQCVVSLSLIACVLVPGHGHCPAEVVDTNRGIPGSTARSGGRCWGSPAMKERRAWRR